MQTVEVLNTPASKRDRMRAFLNSHWGKKWTMRSLAAALAAHDSTIAYADVSNFVAKLEEDKVLRVKSIPNPNTDNKARTTVKEFSLLRKLTLNPDGAKTKLVAPQPRVLKQVVKTVNKNTAKPYENFQIYSSDEISFSKMASFRSQMRADFLEVGEVVILPLEKRDYARQIVNKIQAEGTKRFATRSLKETNQLAVKRIA